MKVRLKNENIKKDYGRELLRLRGIEDVDTFLNPKISTCLESYNDLDNIDKGLELVILAKQNTRVGLIVDCDVDGYTSAAIIYQFLKK